jgi:phosphate starvation-inducible protein PhoH and related proteins
MRKGPTASNGTIHRKLAFADNDLVQTLFGQQNQHLRLIDRLLQIKSNVRGNEVILEGPEPALELAARTLEQLYLLLQAGYPISGQDVQYALRIIRDQPDTDLKTIFLDTVYISALKRRITPKSLNQKNYLQAIRNYDMVFGIGPAGTGKTYLAMAMAVAALVNNECTRIVLTRPAVEAGEKLGFLPGDLFEKVNPYLRPLYDALHDMMDFDKASQLMQRGVIEVAPLAFMRGRTLNNAFVILDEAQNTTSEQMMMFLTRLGFGSKAVITGDITQIDLPSGTSSGLKEVREILTNIEGIAFTYFNKNDVVRHPLVQDIILAYEDYQQHKRRPFPGKNADPQRDHQHDRQENER